MKHKIGIIGFGGMARYHYNTLKKYDRAEVKGIYDVNPAVIEYAKGHNVGTYESKEALLADPEIDLVLIATTNEVHKPLAIEAMAAGKNVICEKPVTLSSEELV